MGYHSVQAAAFGVGTEAPLRLEAALARAGRKVLQRTRLPLDGKEWPIAHPNSLTWVVRRSTMPDGFVLQMQEFPGDGVDDFYQVDYFDLVFLRALSEEIDGFVTAYDMFPSATQDGIAVFFAGRTLEVALLRSGRMSADPCIGLESLDDLGTLVDRAFYHYYEQLFESELPGLFYNGEVILAEYWELTPRALDYELEPDSRDERPICRGLLTYVGEEGQSVARKLLPPGFRVRAAAVGFHRDKLLEVQGPGDVDCTDAFAQLCRHFDQPGTIVTIRGGNGVNSWVSQTPKGPAGWDSGVGAAEVIRGFSTASTFYSLGPGLMFGRGNEGWIG